MISSFRTAGLLFVLLVIVPSASAKVTALRAAPANSDYGLVVHGLGQLEPLINEHIDTMARYGLEGPDIDTYLDLIRESVPRLKKTRGPLVSALGLDEAGSIAFYAHQGPEGSPHVVAVMDITERKAVIKTMAAFFSIGFLEKSSKNGKSKLKIKKERLPGKGLLVTFTRADKEDPLYLRFQGDIAAISDKLEAIYAVQFAGGEPFLGSAVLEDSRVGIFTGINIAGAVAMKMLPPAAGGVKTAQFYGLLQAGRYEAKLDVEVEPDFEPFLSVLRPGANGKAARAAMSNLITDRTDTWWRTSVDLKAAESLASGLLGKGYDKVNERFKRRTGLPLDLVAKSITGDQLVRCDGSFSSCVFASGIIDPEGAESLVRHFFAIMGDMGAENSTQEVSVETKSASGPGESRRMVTTFSIREDLEKKAELLKRAHEYLRFEEERNALQSKIQEAYGDDPDLADALQTELNEFNEKHTNTGLVNYRWEHPERIHDAREIEREAKASKGKKRRAKKKKKKKEPFQPILTLHWGMTDKMVLFGSTPSAVESAMKASSAGGNAASNGKLDDLTVVAGYQARGGLSDVIRQAVPVVRGLLPKAFIGGTVIRIIDGILVAYDESVDGESYMRVSPTHITLHGVSTSLPAKGQEGFLSELSDSYTEAMRLRYAGDLAESNRQLAKLALKHPNTPWGIKANGMVFRADLTGMFVNLGYLGALGDSPIGRDLTRQFERVFMPLIQGF